MHCAPAVSFPPRGDYAAGSGVVGLKPLKAAVLWSAEPHTLLVAIAVSYLYGWQSLL